MPRLGVLRRSRDGQADPGWPGVVLELRTGAFIRRRHLRAVFEDRGHHAALVRRHAPPA
jgi:hypothetical protein